MLNHSIRSQKQDVREAGRPPPPPVPHFKMPKCVGVPRQKPEPCPT